MVKTVNVAVWFLVLIAVPAWTLPKLMGYVPQWVLWLLTFGWLIFWCEAGEKLKP